MRAGAEPDERATVSDTRGTGRACRTAGVPATAVAQERGGMPCSGGPQKTGHPETQVSRAVP